MGDKELHRMWLYPAGAPAIRYDEHLVGVSVDGKTAELSYQPINAEQTRANNMTLWGDRARLLVPDRKDLLTRVPSQWQKGFKGRSHGVMI